LNGKQVRLDLSESIKVVEWLKSKRDELDKRKMKSADVAVWCSKELGVAMNEKNVQHCAKSAGIKWDHGQGSMAPVPQLFSRVAALEERLAVLEKTFA
jgi:hypothetical protein